MRPSGSYEQAASPGDSTREFPEVEEPTGITRTEPSLRCARSHSAGRRRRPDLDLRNEHDVDDLQTFVDADHNRRPSARGMRNEIGMRNVDPCSICKA
jgi:hypothetical protein